MSSKTVVILPTYDEAENLKVLIPQLLACDVDVLVMDDSPNSDTIDVARALGCRAIRRNGQRGRMLAILDGLAAIEGLTDGYDNIITMDADLQHPPDIIPTIMKELEVNDIVVASRNVEGGAYSGFSRSRQIVSKVAKLLAWPLVPNLKDRSSGFVAFKRSVLPTTRLPLGFSTMAVGITTIGNYNAIKEVPYVFGPRHQGGSKLAFKDIINHLVQLARLYIHKFRIIKFGLVGASGVIVNLGLLYTLTEFVELYYVIAYIISFTASVINNYAWNSLWTFQRREGMLGWFRYSSVCTSTLLLGIGLLYVLTTILNLWYMVSATIVILVVFILNYTLSRRIVWPK